MSTYKTVVSYGLTGGRDFTIPFEYLARKFIQVTLVGDGIRTLLTLNTDYRFSTTTTITTNQIWPVGKYREIEIRRFTSATDRLVNFNDGSILRATDLNLSQIQTLHVAEEARDLSIDLLSLDSNGNFDARNHRIVNVADAVNPQDAVTLKQATMISENLFYPPKDFVAGLSVTSNKDTVLYLGSVYSASPAAIPFVTTATFNPTQWLVFSNLGRAELAQPTGAGLIGTKKVGVTVQQELSKGGLVRGDEGKSFISSGGAVRRNTAVSQDWQFVEDATHIPINCVGIEQGVDLNIKYKGDKIGTLIAGPDESFARDGVLVGGSVGPRNALISAGAPCSFVIDFDNSNAITFDNKFFDAVRFTITKSVGGQLSISHPSRRLMMMPVVQHYGGDSLDSPLSVHYVSAPSAGGFTCFLIGETEGHISFNGSNWTIGSSSWTNSEMAFSYNATTGTLTVTHPSVLGSPSCTLTPWFNGSPLHVQMTDVGTTGFKVIFTKPDGTFPAVSAALGFYFCRGVSSIIKNPRGKLHVFLGHVQVNMNHVDYPNGNFWFHTLMHDLTQP